MSTQKQHPWPSCRREADRRSASLASAQCSSCAAPTPAEKGFRSDDSEVVLAPGGYITKPRSQMHAMWNAGNVPGRIIEIITPGGFETYFRELGELLAPHMPARTLPEQWQAACMKPPRLLNLQQGTA